MRQIVVCFAGVMMMVMCVLIMTQLPTRSMVIVHHYVGPDRPQLDLPVAGAPLKVSSSRGLTEISLNREERWVALGRPFEEVDDLDGFLADWAEWVRDHGRVPSLRMRIAGDAPARFMRDAVMVAEELGYAEVLVAVCRDG